MTQAAMYLYCFARPGLDNDATTRPGVDGRLGLHVEARADIAAIVSDTALDEFVGEQAKENMQDLDWVAPRAMRHEQVIEQVARYSPVFPVQFGTLFESPASLLRRLDEHHDTIVAFLDYVADKQEWAVKGYFDRRRAALAVGRAPQEQPAQPDNASSAGARYMRAKREQTQADSRIKEWLQARTNELWQKLSTVTAEVRERKALPSPSDELPGDMVFNWAFLVPKPELATFEERLRRFNERNTDAGLVTVLSGPWPPFSFAPKLDGAGD